MNRTTDANEEKQTDAGQGMNTSLENISDEDFKRGLIRIFDEWLAARKTKPSPKDTDNGICCSFCNKPIEKARAVIVGLKDAYICDECVCICCAIMEEKLGADWQAQYREGEDQPCGP